MNEPADSQQEEEVPESRLSSKNLFRTFVLLSLLILTPLGFATKFYSGPGGVFVNLYLGGILYVMFWMLVLHLVWPDADPLRSGIIVLTITGMLEIMQLWHAPFLESIRASFLGRTLIGTGFDWLDFLFYFGGMVAGILYIGFLRRITQR